MFATKPLLKTVKFSEFSRKEAKFSTCIFKV